MRRARTTSLSETRTRQAAVRQIAKQHAHREKCGGRHIFAAVVTRSLTIPEELLRTYGADELLIRVCSNNNNRDTTQGRTLISH